MNRKALEERLDKNVESAIELARTKGCDYAHIYLKPPDEFPGGMEMKVEPSDDETPSGKDGLVHVSTKEVTQ